MSKIIKIILMIIGISTTVIVVLYNDKINGEINMADNSTEKDKKLKMIKEYNKYIDNLEEERKQDNLKEKGKIYGISLKSKIDPNVVLTVRVPVCVMSSLPAEVEFLRNETIFSGAPSTGISIATIINIVSRTPSMMINLIYPLYSFSGNIDDIYNCPIERDGNIDGIGIYPIGVFQANSNYLISSMQNDNDVLKVEKNNIKIYKNKYDLDQKQTIITLGNFANKKHDLRIQYKSFGAKSTRNSGVEFYSVESVFSPHFGISYAVRITDKKVVNLNTPVPFKIDAGFAINFFNIIKDDELRLVDHPEIFEKFIENNEKIIKYIKTISKETHNGKEFKDGVTYEPEEKKLNKL